jgi:hypothetical protein
MHVELRKQQGVVGTVELVGGSAKASDEANQRFLDSLRVIEPGSMIPLGPESGERYLRALPANLRGSYFWAVLVP